MRFFKSTIIPLLLLVVSLLIAVIILTTIPAKADAEAEQWALVIGISDYRFIDEDLDYPAEDAQELAEQLEPIYGEDHVLLLTDTDASKRGIKVAITAWLDNTRIRMML